MAVRPDRRSFQQLTGEFVSGTLEVLKEIKKEISALVWEKISNDEHTLLIAKADVLNIISEWIEYVAEESK